MPEAVAGDIDEAAAAVAARVRRQQQVEELCGASLRALADQPDLHLRAQRLFRGEQRLAIAAPHVYPSLDTDDFASFRGATDALALRMRHGQLELHRQLAPAELSRRFVFELLEQLRVESLVPSRWPGVRANLRHRFEAWAGAWLATRQLEGTRNLLLFTVAQVCRARLMGEPVSEPVEDAIESTRFALLPRIGVSLAGLVRERHDQAAYAAHALALAETVSEMLAEQAGGDTREDAGAGQTAAAPGFARLLEALELEGDGEAPAPVALHGSSRVLEAAGHRYAVFTRAYDRVQPMTALARPAELQACRERLDRLVAQCRLNTGRLAQELRALLSRPEPEGWQSGQEDGRIDGRRLARLVAQPAERRLFRQPPWQAITRCRLTLLLDCSGSMKRHAEPVAVLVDVLTRALEQAGVEVEVLGFTTGAWQGGRAARDWQRAGRPAQPGRVAELCHRVLKARDTSWRRARPALAGLLKPELFREGVDGEAVEWACARLREDEDAPGAQPERRILVVVSDGSPMETATHLANDEHYLDHHLRQVVQREQARGDVEILGLGVGLDLSPFYTRCQVLDLPGLPGRAAFGEVLALLAGRHRR